MTTLSIQLFHHSQLEPDNGGFIRLRLLLIVQQSTQGCISENERLKPLSAGVVLSNKASITYFSLSTRLLCKLLFITILYFQLIVNLKYFVIVVLFYPYLIKQLLLVNLDHVFVQLQLHE